MPALSAEAVRSSLGRLDAQRHPLLRRLSRHDMYDGGEWMAPGGLLLAEMLADELAVKPGDRVLDLGCGRGQSSVFLASQYQAQVVSVDLWVGAEERRQRAAAAGVETRITALQGDVRRGLPIAAGSLDGIFCMQAFHCFGTSQWLLRYLASLLKPGARIGIAQGCFREEVAVLPPIFAATDGWNAEYGKYHSPGWWRDHFLSSGLWSVEVAREVTEGDVMWEDDVRYRGDQAGWSPEYLERSGWLIRQLLHGQAASPSLTHCMMVASKSQDSPRQVVGS